MEKTTKKRINLGSGLDYRKGYINVDNKSIVDCDPDVFCDLKYYETEDNTVSEIILSHVVMYLRPEELDPLLERWYKWLIVGGTIEIETINFDQVMEYAMKNDKAYGLDCIFGTEKTKSHQWGWNITRLRDIMVKHNFTNIVVSNGDKNPQRDFKILAKK